MMSDASPADLLQERERRINDAIALREPDQVPVMCILGFFPAKIAGITFEETMYDYDKTMESWIRAMVEFQPDVYDDPFTTRFFGRIFRTIRLSAIPMARPWSRVKFDFPICGR